jgi:hypothetical protein
VDGLDTLVVESERRLLGRRYLSGAAFVGVETVPADGLEPGFIVDRRLDNTLASSFRADLLLNEDKSDDEEEVVDTEGAAGYLERFTG